MNCPSAEHLSEWAFLSAAGIDSGPGADLLREHLAHCSACAKAYAESLSIAVAGREAHGAAVHVTPCPDENLLAEYYDGILPPLDCDRVEEHLATCADCVRQLSALHTVLVEAPQRVPRREIVLEWLRDGLRVIRQTAEALRSVDLALAPVLRSGAEPAALAWAAEQGDYTLRITLQQAAAQHLTLHLALHRSGEAASGHRVYVRADGELIESRTTGEDGVVTLLGLPVADYTVEVSIPGETLAIAITFPGGD